MSERRDPSFYGDSGYERLDKDRYFTDPWMTHALLVGVENMSISAFRLPLVREHMIWEPAAGRGDIASVLTSVPGVSVFCSDVDLSDFTLPVARAEECDFLDQWPPSLDPAEIDAIVTNPPFQGNMCEKFVRRALSYEVELVAMLTRLEFGSAKKRMDLFTSRHYAGEIKLTTRPRWDWWWKSVEEQKKSEGPRHYFSWHIWTPGSENDFAVQTHVSKERADKKVEA